MANYTDKNSHLTTRSPLVLSYPGVCPDTELLDWVTEGFVAGVVIFKDNAPTDDVLSDAIDLLRARAGTDDFRVMIDEEGGAVRRLPDSPVSMRSLREYEHENPDMVATAYRDVARRLRTVGVDTLLAPVVDLQNMGTDSQHAPQSQATNRNWLADRTYSDDPLEVAQMVKSVVAAVQGEGIACCAKHFPGTRLVEQDTHLGQAVCSLTQDEWERVDSIPFRAAVAADCQMILVGHQKCSGFDSSRPACLSPLVVRALLRERMGFAGQILTDDLAMGAIAQSYPIELAVTAAHEAGCNFILVCNNRNLQRRAVQAMRRFIPQTGVDIE